MENYFEQHVFFCLNSREQGKACNKDSDVNAFRDYAKKKIKELNLPKNKIRINGATCLGRCGDGNVCVIYPKGIWYRFYTQEDLDNIIQEHLVKGRIVERLCIIDQGMPQTER